MIIRILILSFLFLKTICAQQVDFNSPENIKLFAGFLYCDKDYLRAIDEYKKYLNFYRNDTVDYKVANSFLAIGDYENATNKFSQIKKSSPFYELSSLKKLEVYYQKKDYQSFSYEAENIITSANSLSNNAHKFNNSVLLLEDNQISLKTLLSPFNDEEQTTVKKFYMQKTNPRYKNEIAAGVLSALLPGAGKIYTENYSDGIIAFLLTGVFAYLAYTNFEHDHLTRAWIFTAVGSGFYLGNIYGSVVSAKIFNAKVNFDFREGVKLFIENNNYFIPEYDFCK